MSARLYPPFTLACPLLAAAVAVLGAGCTRQENVPFGPSTRAADSVEAAETWTPLFSGHDLSGWEQIGGAVWTVENGELVGRQGENYAPGDLLSTGEYRDFELVCTYRVVWPANSGIWFRYQTPQRAYQADILEWPDPRCYSGTLYYAPMRDRKLFLACNADPGRIDQEGWNTLRIRAAGEHIQVWLNTHLTADVHDKTSDRGRIGFQVHPGEEFGPMRIIVREIRLRELGSAAG